MIKVAAAPQELQCTPKTISKHEIHTQTYSVAVQTLSNSEYLHFFTFLGHLNLRIQIEIDVELIEVDYCVLCAVS